MKYVHIYTLLLMSVFHTSCGQNQTNVPKDNINPIAIGSETKDSITSQVRNIKQDRNGNILIAASFDGVFRYDGKSFTNLTSRVGSHRFYDVLEDRRGNLWFASLDSGVYYYNGKSLPNGQAGFQHFTTSEGLANNSVRSIYEDKAGIIWFGTRDGISRYDGKSFRNFTTPNAPHDITTIIEDKTGKLWIGTRREAFVYDGKTFTALKDKDGETFNNSWSIIEDKKGNIWFGADGLWRYDGSTFTQVTQRGVYGIIEDKKGNIWTTGNSKTNGNVWALSRYDAKSLYNNKPTVTEIMSTVALPQFLCAIFEANDGSIWFGASNGLYRYDGKTVKKL